METAFSLLFMAKDFPGIYSSRNGRRRAPGDKQEIEDFLRLTFDILTLIDREGIKSTEYDTLAAALRPSDTVITLNYDTLLDSSLVRRGWDTKYGYGISGTPRKFRWKSKSLDSNLRGVLLLKLHGSLNWFVRGSFNDLSSVFFKKPARIEKPRMNEIAGYMRQIIPPIYGKFFDHDHWRTLWDKAYDALRKADVLVVIGCSLIETDFHLRAMVGKMAKWRKAQQAPFRHLFLVDRVKIRRRWAKSLKGAFQCHEGYRTFEEFTRKKI